MFHILKGKYRYYGHFPILELYKEYDILKIIFI